MDTLLRLQKNADKLNNNEKFILVQNTINVSRYQTKRFKYFIRN